VDAIEQSETEGMSDILAALRAKKTRPTAIIAPDPHVRGLIAACAAAGVRVPEDMSIVSISEIGADGYHRKHAISAVTVDPHRMGKAAGAAMLAWLAGSPPADKVRVQAASFIERGTTGPAAKAR
jgi:DNA-binding LacI/PurR family transcriptional regulator